MVYGVCTLKNINTFLTSPNKDCQPLTRIPHEQGGRWKAWEGSFENEHGMLVTNPNRGQRQPLIHSLSALVWESTKSRFLFLKHIESKSPFPKPLSLPCSLSPLTLTFLFFLILSPPSLISWLPYKQISPYIEEVITVAWTSFLSEVLPPQWQQPQTQHL